MTVEQITQLIGVSAWPVTALLGIFVLRPYISQLTRAASDLRDLLDRSGEMVGLVGQVTELNEAMADLKAMQQVAQASRPEPAPTADQPTIEQLWKQLEKQWQETRDRFRAVTQAAGVSVRAASNDEYTLHDGLRVDVANTESFNHSASWNKTLSQSKALKNIVFIGARPFERTLRVYAVGCVTGGHCQLASWST